MVKNLISNFRYYSYLLLLIPIKFPTRYLFGNFAGVFNNVYAFIELKWLKITNSTKKTYNDDSQFLKKEGYCIKRNLYSRELVSSIREQYHEINEETEKWVWTSKNVRKNLRAPQKTIPDFRHFINDDVSEIIKNYYGTNFQITSVRLWRILPSPHSDNDKSELYSNTWHQDEYKTSGLRLFVLMCDNVKKDSGATRFISRSKTKKIMRRIGYWNRWIVSDSIRNWLKNEENINYFEGNFGDVAMLNVQHCLHAANIPKEGTYRDILQFEIYPCKNQSSDLFSQVKDEFPIESKSN